ncbi:MAG: HAD-IIIA family hydrolase [Candidatus Omnitrophica bacterium]|nr:HAD-IIIA family hydrolase [Candidatus Omnitrophota bacterium]
MEIFVTDMLSRKLRDKFKKIKLLLLDVDGVLTDGRIIYDNEGRDAKCFDVHDGLGVSLLSRMGIKTILVTAKGSGCLAHRAKDMRAEAVYRMDRAGGAGHAAKTEAYAKILKKYRLQDEEVCFVGDDLVDLCVLKRCGLPVATHNAMSEIKKAAVYVTARAGGRGAVREVAELILKSKGLWKKAVERYLV